MEDSATTANKLDVLNYIDDFIKHNVKVLENPRYTDIGAYHKLMEKIKSKKKQESCGTQTLKWRTQILKRKKRSAKVKNSSANISTSVHEQLDETNNVVANCDFNASLIKEEVLEIKTEVFDFEPSEHGICKTEDDLPEYVGINSDNSDNTLTVDVPLKQEDPVTPDCESKIKEFIDIRNDYCNIMIKDEPIELIVPTDLVELELDNDSLEEMVKIENNCNSGFISNINPPTSLEQNFINNQKSSCMNKSKRKLMKNRKEKEITIKDCYVPLVKVEDELLRNCKTESDLLLTAGKSLTFYPPEDLHFLINKLDQRNLDSKEILLFLNTNDVVTRMYMDRFPQLKSAVVGNKVKIIDKTVADIYARVQGLDIYFDTYVQQNVTNAAITKYFGRFKKNLKRLT